MADQTDVIQHQMEETRQRLAENLDKLTSQTVGTVEEVAQTVSEAVGAVQETVGAVKETVQSVTGTVQGAVENVTSSVQQTVGSVKETFSSAFDLPTHVQNYPWLCLGGAVAVGYVAGCLLTPRTAAVAEGMSAAAGQPGEPQSWWPGTGYTKPATWSSSSVASDSSSSSSRGQSSDWLSGLFGALSPSLDKLKGLALGATLGLAREALTGSMSGELGKQLGQVFDDMTERLGGQPIHSGLPQFGGQDQGSPQGQGQGHAHG